MDPKAYKKPIRNYFSGSVIPDLVGKGIDNNFLILPSLLKF